MKVFEIIVIIACIVVLIILKFLLNISFKKIRNLNTRKSEELENLAIKFPNDEKICKDILKKMNNENVRIKMEPEYGSCLYTVFNKTITIGKFKQNYSCFKQYLYFFR